MKPSYKEKAEQLNRDLNSIERGVSISFDPTELRQELFTALDRVALFLAGTYEVEDD